MAFAAVLASLGFRRGFIVGVLSFGGFAIGAFLGTRLGPLLLPRGSSSPYAPAFGLFGALLAGAILASGLEGVGLRLRRALIVPGLGVLDGLLGAALGVALGLGIVWVLAAVAAQDDGPEDESGHDEVEADRAQGRDASREMQEIADDEKQVQGKGHGRGALLGFAAYGRFEPLEYNGCRIGAT